MDDSPYQINVEYVGDSLRSLHALGSFHDLAFLAPAWRTSSGASDSGSDCPSPVSSAFSSPLFGPFDELAQPSSSISGLEDMPHLSLSGTGIQSTALYTLQDTHATLSSASLAYSDSGPSSLLDFFPYSPSPQTSVFSSAHSQSPSPVVGSLTLTSSQEDHLSYPLTPSPPISVSDDPFLTSGPFEHYAASSPSPSHSFGRPLPSSEPPQSIGISEVTEFINEASECQSHLDPANIRAQLLHTFSPDSGDPNAGTLKTLFSKNAKTSVSTPAGRAASALRRKHPARFACQFCDATFTRKLGLENHNKSHLGITDQQCRFCLKLFPNSLPRHMKRCKDNPERIAPRKTTNFERGKVSESQSSVV